MSCWPVAAYLAAARGAEPLELDELAEPDDAPEKADPDPAAAADEAGAAGAASPSPTPDDDELPEQPAATAATMRDTEVTAAALRRRPCLVRMPLGRDRGHGRLRRQVTIRPHAAPRRHRRAARRHRRAPVHETPVTYAKLEACPTIFA
jgi:hypothetical protein